MRILKHPDPIPGRRKNVSACIIVAICLVSASSCKEPAKEHHKSKSTKTEPTTEDLPEASATQDKIGYALNWTTDEFGLLHNIREPQLKICAADASAAEKKSAESAVTEWLRPLKMLDETLNPKIAFACPGDVRINFGSSKVPDKADGKTATGRRPVIEIHERFRKTDPDRLFRYVVLHELGHAFGLADTYNSADKKGSGCTVPMNSVMCGSGFPSLTVGDCQGVIAAYKILYDPKFQALVNNKESEQKLDEDGLIVTGGLQNSVPDPKVIGWQTEFSTICSKFDSEITASAKVATSLCMPANQIQCAERAREICNNETTSASERTRCLDEVNDLLN